MSVRSTVVIPDHCISLYEAELLGVCESGQLVSRDEENVNGPSWVITIVEPTVADAHAKSIELMDRLYRFAGGTR